MVNTPQTKRPEIRDYFAKYSAIVYRRALVLMGSQADAEDAVQEVFLKIAANFDSFRGESQVSTWLYKITTNYCLSQLRNRGRQGELLRDRYEHTAPRIGSNNPMDGVALRQLLAKADPQEASAAVYVYVDGMTRPEAAQALSVSLRTIGNLLNRFSQWAREEFQELDPSILQRFSDEAGESTQNSPIALPDSPQLRVYITGGNEDDPT